MLDKEIQNKQEIEDSESTTQVVEKMGNIDESLNGICSLIQTCLESFESQAKESSKMKAEMHNQDVQLEDRKHKRSIILITFGLVIIAVLCLTAFFTDNAQYVDKILTISVGILGGAGASNLFKKKE